MSFCMQTILTLSNIYHIADDASQLSSDQHVFQQKQLLANGALYPIYII